jgi:hypothetical protein
MVLRGREHLRHPRTRKQTGRDKLGYPGVDRSFGDIERPVDHHLEGRSWFLGGLGEPNGSQVKHGVDALEGGLHGRSVAQLALDHRDRPVGERPRQVPGPATCELFEDDDLTGR